MDHLSDVCKREKSGGTQPVVSISSTRSGKEIVQREVLGLHFGLFFQEQRVHQFVCLLGL